MKRDPRVDPKPGDILKRGKVLRRVTYGANAAHGSAALIRYTDGIKDFNCLLSSWRRHWAKRAKVIHGAE